MATLLAAAVLVLTMLYQGSTRLMAESRAHVGPVTAPATATHISARPIPAGLQAAIGHTLGGMELQQTMRDDGGLHVSEGSGSSVAWSLVPTALSRVGSHAQVLRSASPVASAGRSTYDLGALSAWYRHTTSGIEQGFSIAHRLSGSGSSIAIDMHSGGTLRPVIHGRDGLALVSRSGRTILNYGELRVADATGRVIPARLAVTGRHVKIIIDDRGATYPLAVDPLVQVAELTGANSVAFGGFGVSVAISASGSVALVGAFRQTVNAHVQQGAAYVFSGPNWTNQVELTASDGVAGDEFGNSVALSASGTTALIGAYQKPVGANSGQGEAYIFTGSGTNWTQQAILTASDGTAEDVFGVSVALSPSGTTALIGAQGHSNSEGAAYVFSGGGSSWTQKQEIAPSGLVVGAYFGTSMALSADGTVAIIGAPNQVVGSHGASGAAYVYGGSNWGTQLAELVGSDSAASDQFGFSVALSGNGGVALVGAYQHQVGSNAVQGSAYVFSGTNWANQTELVGSDGGAGDHFGYAVGMSTSGGTALVGAPWHSVGGQIAGAVYTYGGTNWANQSEGTASDGGANARFGYSVAIASAGTVTLVGAYQHTAVNAGQGAAYILGSVPVASASLISASPSSISANGTSTSTVTVQAVDANGNNLALGGATVTLATTAGTLGPVTDNGNGTYSATLTSTTSPGTATITGTLNGSAIGNSATVTFTAASTGYWTVAGDGGVFSFGPNFYGSTGNLKLNQPVFAITSTADGEGYWFVARDGGVFTYGDGVFHGSVPALGVHVTNIVGMAADTATGGYWLVGSDGGVYAFGAPFDGSVPGLGQHVSNVVGIAATADGGGYYLVTSTGAVYAFGDAKYQGGANTLPRINAPIVGITVDSATGGYWLAGSDGGIYAYGAPFHGSAGGSLLNKPVVGISATTDGSGYYLVASDGGVFSYNAPFLGSMGGKHLNAPMVGITVAG